ncbi:MAG TPA: hypothetical protein VGB85_15755, partial [Nannocystis sp.]
MRPALLLSLLLPACLADPPALVLDGAGCDEIDLAVLDPAVLPGWTVHALVSESAEGDTAWTLATDPDGALLLKPWPEGPALDLSQLGEPGDFSLIRGRTDHESWLLLDRQDHLRVWRLGRAARGEVTPSPDLSGFPGPGGWHYSLLLVGDVPYLLAAATGVQARMMRFQLAPLDPDHLALGPAGPALRFADLCMPLWEQPCSIFARATALAEVDELATTEAGAMPGAAVLLGVQFADGSPISSGFIQLQLDDRGPGFPPGVIGRMLALAGGQSPRLHGRISSDGENLFTSVTSLDDDTAAPAPYFHIDFALADPTSLSQLGLSPYNGPILQFGREVVMTHLARGRW